MATTASPNDLLLAYPPGSLPEDRDDGPLEDRSSGPFGEMTGGADTHYEDFTSGLRAFVESQREAGEPMGGTWYGGSGANPAGIVLGLDWMEENMDLEGALEDPPEPEAAEPEAEGPLEPDPAEDPSEPEAEGIMGAVVAQGPPEPKAGGSPEPAAGMMSAVVSVGGAPPAGGRREPEGALLEEEWVFADPALH